MLRGIEGNQAKGQGFDVKVYYMYGSSNSQPSYTVDGLPLVMSLVSHDCHDGLLSFALTLRRACDV